VIKSRIVRWEGYIEHMGEERGVFMVLVGKPEGKRPFGIPRRRWEDNMVIVPKSDTVPISDSRMLGM
jgi:hypothetical protein